MAREATGRGHRGARRLSSVRVHANRAPLVLLADPMEGVRAAWRWILSAEDGIGVAGEAGSVAEAVSTDCDVVLSGLRYADGTAADLIAAAAAPVVVWTFLPEDERDIDLSGAAAVLRAGELRQRLAAVLREVSARSGS